MNKPNNLGVFIDGDSVSPKNLDKILSEIRINGNIIVQKIYADWSISSKKNILEKSKINGIETVQADMIMGKNSTDLKMAVDIMDILFNYNSIDSYYLVINDADYRHLIPKIKQKGKYVYCIGPEHTNQSLINICNSFTKIPNITKENKVKDRLIENKTNDKIYLNSITKFLEKSKKPVNLSSIKELLERMHNFDLRETNYSRFKPYIKETFKNSLRVSNNSRNIVSLKD